MALSGIKVVEIAGLAPAPFAGLVLADFGADVIRVDRSSKGNTVPTIDILARGKRSICLDLKSSQGLSTVKKLVSKADVLIEPFRPGVMERLGLGPEEMLKLNPKLVYARMTGFGQGGLERPGRAAGHDANYVAQAGVLSALQRHGPKERPLPPVNLLGDFGGGGLLCALGILLALQERTKSGKGQVVDAAMVDGVAYLASVLVLSSQLGAHDNSPDKVGTNLLDTGAHFYETYRTKDGRFMSVGAIEPQFYEALLKGMGLDKEKLPKQMDKSKWVEMKKRFEQVFETKTLSEWTDIFKDVDACVFPIMTLEEARNDPHNLARETFVPSESFPGMKEAAAAPKLSRTPAVKPRKNPEVGQHTIEVLKEAGFSEAEVKKFLESQNVVQAKL